MKKVKKFFVTGLVVTVLLAGLVLLYLFIPPESVPGTIVGIDVSHHQSKIDWDKVNNSGIGFVYAKATEGATYRDRYWEEIITRCTLPVGSYHLYSNYSSPEKQFANFKNYTSGHTHQLIPVVDIEANVIKYKKFSLDSVQKLLQFFEAEYGMKPIIYTSEFTYLRHLRKLMGYKFWIANYNRRPLVRHYIWQTSEKHTVPGIEKLVDKNIIYRWDFEKIKMPDYENKSKQSHNMKKN
jgi:lysozyme